MVSNSRLLAAIDERVREKFIRSFSMGPRDQCWEWEGTIAGGTGKFYIPKLGMTSAHRVAFVLFKKEEIPKDLVVLHKCGNKLCMNPYHMELVEPYKLLQRDRNGEKSSSAKLKEYQVRDIYILYFEGQAAEESLAEHYGVSVTCIRSIVTGKNWKYLYKQHIVGGRKIR